jgi:hypothetical protein
VTSPKEDIEGIFLKNFKHPCIAVKHTSFIKNPLPPDGYTTEEYTPFPQETVGVLVLRINPLIAGYESTTNRFLTLGNIG